MQLNRRDYLKRNGKRDRIHVTHLHLVGHKRLDDDYVILSIDINE